jgi:hypothetical protein
MTRQTAENRTHYSGFPPHRRRTSRRISLKINHLAFHPALARLLL